MIQKLAVPVVAGALLLGVGHYFSEEQTPVVTVPPAVIETNAPTLSPKIAQNEEQKSWVSIQRVEQRQNENGSIRVRMNVIYYLDGEDSAQLMLMGNVDKEDSYMIRRSLIQGQVILSFLTGRKTARQIMSH